MIWKAISEGLPEAGQEVLLHWPVPDRPPIYRLGKLLCKPILDDLPIWKFDLDYGDAGAWVFTNRGDEQPTYWALVIGPEDPAIASLIAKGWAVRLPDGGWALTELGRDAADDLKMQKREGERT